jgi:hypothetical protein
MNRKSRIVAFAAVLGLAGIPLAADPLAAADRRGAGGTPQQGMSNSHQAGPVDAQAKGQVDYHADYRAKGTQDDADAKTPDEARADAQRDRDRERERDPRRAPFVDRTLGRTPGAWGR